MRSDSSIEVFALLYPERNDQLNVKITLRELEITLAQNGFIRRDKYSNDIIFYLVAETVGLFLVESDDEITQTIDAVLKRLVWLQETDCRWYLTTKNRRSVFIQAVEHQRQAECSRKRVYRRVFADRDEDIR